MASLLIILAVFAADVYLKYKIEKEPDGFRKEALGGRILLRKSHNSGAMLNLLEKRQQLVAGFSLGIAASLTFAYAYLLEKRGMRLLKTGLAFLLGGAYSNVFDRIKRGYVVDYFSFQIKWERFRKIVFNLGDIFIFLGAFLVIFWNGRRKS